MVRYEADNIVYILILYCVCCLVGGEKKFTRVEADEALRAKRVEHMMETGKDEARPKPPPPPTRNTNRVAAAGDERAVRLERRDGRVQRDVATRWWRAERSESERAADNNCPSTSHPLRRSL
jgi:hypothetical protein